MTRAGRCKNPQAYKKNKKNKCGILYMYCMSTLHNDPSLRIELSPLREPIPAAAALRKRKRMSPVRGADSTTEDEVGDDSPLTSSATSSEETSGVDTPAAQRSLHLSMCQEAGNDAATKQNLIDITGTPANTYNRYVKFFTR